MESLNKTLELAALSFEGENYQDSYKKFSEVVEYQTDNVEGWIGKALSSAHLAEPNGNKFKEATVCLRKASELEIIESKKEFIASHINMSAIEFIKKINQKISKVLLDNEKKPMATGELYAVRNVGMLADRFKAFNDEWENYKVAIQFAFTSLTFLNSIEIKKKVLELIDLIYSESNSHFHKDILIELSTFRNEIITQIKETEPGFIGQDPKSSNSGCFIATAVYGNYDAPEVKILREFRDSFLSKYKLGQLFIKEYYNYSPPIASVIKKNYFLIIASKHLLIIPVTKIWLIIKQKRKKYHN